tara:strand:- start:4386 stop:4892 length:507 start_codon:yes stop_codon:yes gene_type:complete
MGFSIKAGGVWKDGAPFVRIGGTWKTPDALYVRVGGVWKNIYTPYPVEFSAAAYFADTTTAGAAQVAIQFKADGDIDALQTGGISKIGTWVAGTFTASDYEIRLVKSGGTETLSTVWTALSTSPFYSFTADTAGATKIWSGTAEIRNATTLVVIDTATINLTAENTSP